MSKLQTQAVKHPTTISDQQASQSDIWASTALCTRQLQRATPRRAEIELINRVALNVGTRPPHLSPPSAFTRRLPLVLHSYRAAFELFRETRVGLHIESQACCGGAGLRAGRRPAASDSGRFCCMHAAPPSQLRPHRMGLRSRAVESRWSVTESGDTVAHSPSAVMHCVHGFASGAGSLLQAARCCLRCRGAEDVQKLSRLTE